jgi:hypothetical protein
VTVYRPRYLVTPCATPADKTDKTDKTPEIGVEKRKSTVTRELTKPGRPTDKTDKTPSSVSSVLAAVRARPGLYLWQQLEAGGVPYEAAQEQAALFAAVGELLARGEVRQAGTTPREPVSLWMTLVPREETRR